MPEFRHRWFNILPVGRASVSAGFAFIKLFVVRPFGFRALLAAGLLFFTVRLAPHPVVAAGGVVGDGTPGSCTDAALDAALVGGGNITFDCGADPVSILISSAKIITEDTAVDGAGLVTIDGAGQTRIFHLTGDPTLTLENLVLENGFTSGEGAAVFLANQGTLIARSVTFLNHLSTAGGSHQGGGAIASDAGQNWNASLGSQIQIENATFIGNQAGNGGAIASGNAALIRIVNSSFQNNAGTKTGLFDGGGAIYAKGGSTVIVQDTTFDSNQASNGGAIHLLNANLFARGTIFTDNQATNTNLANGGGGAIYVDEGDPDHLGMVVLQLSTFDSNTAHPHGGALFNWIGANGSIWIDRSSFSNNVITGNGVAGSGQGGAVWHGSGDQSPLVVTASTFQDNRANINGGAIWVNVPAHIMNSTFAGNQAINPALPTDNWQRGFGGALSGGAGVHLLNNTFSGNHAGFVGGSVAASGSPGLPDNQSGMIAENTIFVNNTGGNIWGIQQNCTRNLTDAGGNLQYPARVTGNWNDYECLENQASVDPLLQGLADNGGPTLTVALDPGSPAAGIGSSGSCPVFDQRGLLRGAGPCDGGAYELGASVFSPTARLYLPVVMRD